MIPLLAIIVITATYVCLCKLGKARGKSNIPSGSRRKRNNGWRYRSRIEDTPPVTLPNDEPLVIPDGKFEQKVFTYDGRPLKGTRKGSRFTLDVVPGYHTMVSVYTGTEWSSHAAVAYRNHLIGHIGEGPYKERIEMLMLKYPYVRVHARRDGTDTGGWPYITLTLPPLSWFDRVLGN